MSKVYEDLKKFVSDRHDAKQKRGDKAHFAAHCDSRVLHKKEDCRYCAMPEFDDLHKYRYEHNILHTGEEPRSGWWACPAEHERGLKSVNSWGGNTAKPEGCTCGWFINPDNPCPVHK